MVEIRVLILRVKELCRWYSLYGLMRGIEDSLIWADSGTYEYSTRFSIFEAKCLEQNLGSERVEERLTGARLSELFDELIFYSGFPLFT